jgi:formate hydrogenlyase subunit 6/NADH:ubiquinone oxidoreductase subunit I
MGHTLGHNIYKKLGKKIGSLAVRAPWNDTFYSILKELYTEEEADVVVKMPYSMSKLPYIEKTTKYEKSQLLKILDSLCSKGLVMDLSLNGEYHYMPSPMVVGIFELTMMRTGGDLDIKKLAKLFNIYMEEGLLFSGNLSRGEQVFIARALPYEESIHEDYYHEVLDYEKATALVEDNDTFCIGHCSCRREKLLAEVKECDTPLEKCSQFGYAADFMIRHKLAKKVSKTEMLENLAQSKKMGLVLNADNVKKNITFICHCCGCCCNLLLGISKHGYANTIVTSSFIAETNDEFCIGCGKCAKACPISARKLVALDNPKPKKKKIATTDMAFCIGCGACSTQCNKGALKLVNRGQRVIHPENTFERILLQCLERGTLQNQIFDNPQRISHKFMRGFVGGFLKLSTIKKALMSDMFRSSFLNSMKKGVHMQGKGWLEEI